MQIITLLFALSAAAGFTHAAAIESRNDTLIDLEASDNLNIETRGGSGCKGPRQGLTVVKSGTSNCANMSNAKSFYARGFDNGKYYVPACNEYHVTFFEEFNCKGKSHTPKPPTRCTDRCFGIDKSLKVHPKSARFHCVQVVRKGDKGKCAIS